jgi:hypothetical protein
MPYVWLALALFIAIGSGTAGWKIAKGICNAKEAAVLQAAAEARKVDESFSQGVSAAYEGVAAQLRRISTVNRVEINREVQRVEYKCPLPDEGRAILNHGIDAANRVLNDNSGSEGASPGQPDKSLRDDPKSDGKGLGGTSNSLFGTDGDLR